MEIGDKILAQFNRLKQLEQALPPLNLIADENKSIMAVLNWLQTCFGNLIVPLDALKNEQKLFRPWTWWRVGYFKEDNDLKWKRSLL